MAKRPVLAIGLDAAEPSLVERWMAEGHLPALARLRALGAYGRVQNLQTFVAETPWTTFLTGCRPEQTGFWSQTRFLEDSYGIDPVGVYDFEKSIDGAFPDPDLIVLWRSGAVDVVDSPSLGRIGPVPFPRAGTHVGTGFLLATGPGIAPGTEISAAHAVDMAPTILSLMAASPAAYMEGRPLLS